MRIDGIVEEYPLGSGQRQVRIDYLEPVEILDLEDFLPGTKRDLAEMQHELQQVCRSIENPYLFRLLDDIFSDPEVANTFSKAPAAKMYHHAYIGGLLEHSLTVVRLCSFLCDEHPEIDRNLLLTAAIFHDVGKTRAYTTGPLLDFTDEGKLIDHLVEGALIVQRAIDSIEDFPIDLRNRLHHGQDVLRGDIGLDVVGCAQHISSPLAQTGDGLPGSSGDLCWACIGQELLDIDPAPKA